MKKLGTLLLGATMLLGTAVFASQTTYAAGAAAGAAAGGAKHHWRHRHHRRHHRRRRG